MGLLLEQVKVLVKEKPRQKEIADGVYHQSRLKFHTETTVQKDDLSPYYRDYLAWIGCNKPELLPAEKIARFKQLMTVPLATIGLTESIEDSLARVFDGHDAFHRYDIENPKIAEEWEAFRDRKFWRTQGVEAMMNAIDSVWVVDYKDEEPSNLLIDISTVIDINTDADGFCHWVLFVIGDKLFVYDDEAITVYQFDDGSPRVTDGKKVKRTEADVGEEISRFDHGLGYCPAKMFWSKFIRGGNWINHQAPLTNVLGDLDWLLTHVTFKKYMDIANSFPILVTYQTDDDYTDLDKEKDKGRPEQNKETLSGSNIGSGTVMQVPQPAEGEPDLMDNPVKFIAPEVENLEFHTEEITRQADLIYLSVVGTDGEEKNDMAKNEKQVMASFESQEQKLKNVQKNFEIIITFAEKTIIFLKYGVEVEPSIDFGSKHFLRTATDLFDDIEKTKGNEIMNDALNRELLDIKFRNDKMGRTRANIILDLDPLPGRTIEEAKIILDAGGITSDIFRTKVNLMNFVRRFEREQLPLEEFIETGDYNSKIEMIKGKFKDYESEFQKEGQGQRDDEGEPEPKVSN